MIIETIFIVALSVFSVFGIHFCLRLLAEAIFADHYPAAVYAKENEDPQTVMINIKNARQRCLCGKCGVIVLVEGENTELVTLLETEGVSYARIKQESQ